jgi:sugar (pentulose or hexulose) kinase
VVRGSGFWHSLLALDRAGKPLTPIFTWADARFAEGCGTPPRDV